MPFFTKVLLGWITRSTAPRAAQRAADVVVLPPEEPVAGPSSLARICELEDVELLPRTEGMEVVAFDTDDTDDKEADAETEVPRRQKTKLKVPFFMGDNLMVESLFSKGSFGLLYKGTRFPRPGSGEVGQPIALKFERKAKKEGRKSFVKNEFKIYELLVNEKGFSKVFCRGLMMDRFEVLIMELHGPSLDNLIKSDFNFLGLKTVLMLGVELIEKVETLHSKQIIHRDIKPANIVIGRGADYKSVYIIDFGLSTLYEGQTEPEVGSHFCGTLKFSSVNVQSCVEPMYRDDIESLFYTLLCLLKGDLPWNCPEFSDIEERTASMKAVKATMPVEEICSGVPVQFAIFLNYCRELKYADIPDYDYLKRLFKDLFSAQGYTWDYDYDWVTN